jgi:hypothetical protein
VELAINVVMSGCSDEICCCDFYIQMATPTIMIFGVYKPFIPAAVYQEQWQVTGSDGRTDAHFKNLVLIEAAVDQIDGRFKMGDFGQPYTLGDYPDHFQCAYDETLLSSDGKSVVERSMRCVKGEGLLRFAFYLHFYDASRPLQWT